MGLFDKKYCDFCGEKIGLLGNRKLSDGNMCKDCANKLSPWFSERKSSTKAEIEQQLAYREANRQEVASFNITRTMGVDKKVLVDEHTMKFMVTSAKNIAEANPDVIDCSLITGCRVDVRDHKTEEKYRNSDGQMVSYNPPRYTYTYDFEIIISLNHPYFDEIRFKPVNSSVKIESGVHNVHMSGGQNGSLLGKIVNGVVGNMDPTRNADYLRRQDMCNEIITVLNGSRQSARSTIDNATVQQQSSPKHITCEYCGGMNEDNGSGVCIFCGAKL